MKKVLKLKGWLLLAWVITLLISFTGCSGGSGSGKSSSWEFEPTIQEPLRATSGSEEIVLGSIDREGVEVIIPADTFAEPVEVRLLNPENVPGFSPSRMTGFGAPIEICVGEEEVRLLQLVTIRMKYDPSVLSEDLESGALYFVYYNGTEREPIKAVVDSENQIMSFQTSHFCLFGKAELPLSEQIEQYTANQALGKWAQKQANSVTDKALEGVIDYILKERLNIDDKKVTGQIINSIIKDDEWGDMLKSLSEKDPAKFNQGMQVLLGKKIIANVPKSTLSAALKKLTGSVKLVEKASEAAGYLAEGRTVDAARIIGEHLYDKFMITTAGKIAVAAVDHQIKTWTNREVEAAYNVYKNGASSHIPWWGYNVEKENFEQVWEQMGGAARQLIIDAIAAQESARKDAGMSTLTEAEKETIRKMIKEDLKKQFKERLAVEEEIDEIKAEYELIVDMFEREGFLQRGNFDWYGGYELEQRLDVLLHFANKMLKDTGRSHVIGDAFHTDQAITIHELEIAARIWFGTSDPAERKKEYEEYLMRDFGISLTPKLDEIVGSYDNATMTILEVFISDTIRQAIKQGVEESLEGCDPGVIVQIKELEGEVKEIRFSVVKTSDNAGTLNFLTEEGKSSESQSLPFTFQNGILEINHRLKEDDQEVVYSGRLEAIHEADNVVLSGTFRLEIITPFGPGQFYIDTLITGSKPL